ncbi:unnamed protein product [Paramecium sonneborni]|uniref:G domain-containing protein n=1 Tax=Paramecium sonneborni TaxID=65129 RepID=A0A8S1R6X2_9CILI|nr:unnamed protein product [Paramecium sonneborni]
MNSKIQKDRSKINASDLNKFIEKLKLYYKDIDLNGKKEKTAVILFGKTRVGKSTIFHILKGDELIKSKQKTLMVDFQGDQKNYIGQEWQSFTKYPNIFSQTIKNKNGQIEEIDIIDTPGFDDTQNKFDDLIPQIQLLQILKSYKKVILVMVASYVKNNIEFFKKPLKLVQDLFESKQDFNSMLQNSGIFLIINQIKDNYFQEFNKQLDKEINNNDSQDDNSIIFQSNTDKYNISIEFLKYIKYSLCIMKPCAEKHQQIELKENIFNFIQQERQNHAINYKLSITVDGKTLIQNILSEILDIFQREISNSIEKFIQQTEKQVDLKKQRDQLVQFSQLLPENIFLLDLNEFYFLKLTDYFNSLNYINCKSEDLEKFKFLFQEEIIKILFFNLKETFKNLNQYQIQLVDNKQKIWQIVKTIQEQIIEQIQLDNIQEEICKQIEQSIKAFQQYSECNNFLVFIGNPFSGKSTSINLLYNCQHKQMHFYNTLMMIHFGQIKYDEVVTFGQKDQDLIIEFQQFSKDYVILLQYFFAFCKKNKKSFSLQIVLDDRLLNQDIQSGLKMFMDLNNIQNIEQLNIIVNIKQGSQLPQKIDLQTLDSIIQSPKYLKIYTIHKEFQNETLKWNNFELFQNLHFQKDEKLFLELSKSLYDKANYINEKFIKNFIIMIDTKQYFKQNQEEQEIKLFVSLIELNPQSSEEQFVKKLIDIHDIIPPSFLSMELIIKDRNIGKHHKLRLLFQNLIEKYFLIGKIFSFCEKCYSKFYEIEMVIQKYTLDNDLNQIDKINLLIESFDIRKDLLTEDEKESLKQLKLFFELFYIQSKYKLHSKDKIKSVYLNSDQENNNNMNSLIIQLNNLKGKLKNLNVQILSLLKVLKNTQYKGYETLDNQFPFCSWSGRFSYWFGLQDNQEIIQNVELIIQKVQQGKFKDHD